MELNKENLLKKLNEVLELQDTDIKVIENKSHYWIYFNIKGNKKDCINIAIHESDINIYYGMIEFNEPRFESDSFKLSKDECITIIGKIENFIVQKHFEKITEEKEEVLTCNDKELTLEIKDNQKEFIDLLNKFIKIAVKYNRIVESYYIGNISILGFTINNRDQTSDFIGFDKNNYVYYIVKKTQTTRNMIIKTKITNQKELEELKNIKSKVLELHMKYKMYLAKEYGTLRLSNTTTF